MSEGLSEAERQSLIDTIADGRVSDSITQHGPAKDHALLHRVLRAECARFVEHAAPAVERIVAERVRVVEGERDAARAKVGALADQWDDSGWLAPEEVAALTARAESAVSAAETKARAEALREAADEIEEECSSQSGACFCGSAKWLRDRADNISRGDAR